MKVKAAAKPRSAAAEFLRTRSFQASACTRAGAATVWKPLLTFLCAMLVGLAGCSDGNPKTYPVHGQVKFTDGKPVTAGTIQLESLDYKEPITAIGLIMEDETFELGTYDVDDGAVAGRHRVVVLGDGEIGTGIERPELLPPPTVHPRFRQWAQPVAL